MTAVFTFFLVEEKSEIFSWHFPKATSTTNSDFFLSRGCRRRRRWYYCHEPMPSVYVCLCTLLFQEMLHFPSRASVFLFTHFTFLSAIPLPRCCQSARVFSFWLRFCFKGERLLFSLVNFAFVFLSLLLLFSQA